MTPTVTNQGRVQFMIYSTNMNSQLIIAFMEQLIKGREKKIDLILESLRVQHRKIVKEWLEKEDVKNKLAVYYLPS
jgi:hypothetical protein